VHEKIIRDRTEVGSCRAGDDGTETTPIEWFVGEIARDLRLRTAATDIRSRRLIYRLPLDREVIFDPDTVERFVEVGLRGSRSAATYRSILRSIAPKLTKRAPWEPRPTRIPRRHIALPYAPGDITVLVGDAFDQPTKSRNRGARALLASMVGGSRKSAPTTSLSSTAS
jgi:hypothetical protein